MELIIAGSRDLNINYTLIQQLMVLFNIDVVDTVLSGNSGKVDLAGEDWAKLYHSNCRKFPADWNKHGKAAGPIRNKEMAQCATALFLIWDGASKGSSNMRSEMLKLKKPIYEVIIREIE